MVKSIREVGRVIKELRQAQKMTGEELGYKVGISQSKISKIETGFYTRLQPDEVKRMLNILKAPSTISQQLLRIVHETQSKEGPGVSFSNIRFALPNVEIERGTRHIKIYTASAIPALLQTTKYRVASLRY